MISFSAAVKDELNLNAAQEGAIWLNRYTGRPITKIHRHTELEANLIVAGTARYLLEDRFYELRPHSLVWLFPDQNHILLDQSADYQMWIAVFKPTLLGRFCTDQTSRLLLETNPTGHFSKSINLANSRQLADLCQSLLQSTANSARFNAGLGYWLLTAWEAYSASQNLLVNRVAHPAVRQALQLMQETAAPLSQVELAAQSGLSVSRLGHLFREQTGLSLLEFQNNQFLKRFMELYRPDAPATMLETALQAGFGSYPQFYRVFRQRTGLSPLQYYRPS